MTSVLKTAVTADKTLLSDGQTIDAVDVTTPIDDLIANDQAGRVAVTANDTHVKNLDDALTVAAGLLKSVTSPAGDEGLQLALATALEAFRSSHLDGSGDVALTGLQQGSASSGQVLTWSGTAWGPAAAGGGGASPVDLTVTAGENLAERDVVFKDTDDQWYKLDTNATGSIKASSLRGIVNEAGGILSAATGSVRIMGEVSGFTGLTAWGDVYASTTAGGYTQTKPTVSAGGGQVAIARIGYATSTTSVMVWPGPIEFLKRESLANDATLTIEHYSDALERGRDLSAYVSSTEAGAALTEYASSNQDESLWLRGPSGAGATTTPSTSTASEAIIGKNSGGTLARRAQSFEVTAGKLTQITFRLGANDGSPTGNIGWEIRDDNAGDPGTLLQSGEITPTASAVNTINVSDGIFLAASTTYWLVLYAVNGASFANSTAWNWHMSSSSTYANGERSTSTDGGSSWSASSTEDHNCTITTSAETAKDKLAQSFQLAAGATVGSVKLWLKKIGAPTGTLTCRIETDSAGSPSGTLADANATVTVAESTLATTYGEIEFDFATDFSLSGSTTYWIVLSTDRVASATNYVAWGADESTPGYASGEMKSEASSTWSAESADAVFGVYPPDTAFEEICVIGRWSGGTRDVAARFDDGSGADSETKTTFKNVSGATLDVTCIVELE